MCFSPFEQFLILPYIPLYCSFWDLSFSNAIFCLFIIFLFFIFICNLLKDVEKRSFYAIPTFLEMHLFLYYIALQSIIEKHIHVKYYQQLVFPILFSLGLFLFFINLCGNLPIFMSLSSHFAIISALCIPLMLGFFILFFILRNITFLRTFYAPGTDITLGIVLFPVELLTFFMRPVSLICRLCSNIMSGHVIVKVCLHTIFALSQVKNSSNLFLSFIISFLVFQLLPLFLLEFCVSIIQVYVFIVIFCMFLNDLFGHHFTN